jgi:hypothetical protein
MALSNSISQIVAVSYPAVLKAMRGAANQWAESSFMRELERQGGIVRKALGPTIECPLDYQRNGSAQILATDFTNSGASQTEVVGTASFTPVGVSVAVNWSKLDEAKNPSENQKINFVKQLLENAIQSHDDLIETTVLGASSNGLTGFADMITEDGTGTIGGIVAGTDTFWKNQFEDWGTDDLVPHFSALYDACAKGSGSVYQPTLIVSGAATHGTYEGELQTNQRYVDASQATAGFKVIMVKASGRYIYSPHGGESAYFINPKNYKLVVSSDYFRAKGDTQELENVQGFNFKIFSALQAVTDNRSRLGVAFT